MAAKKKSTKSIVKRMVGGKEPTRCTYDGKRLVIVFGNPDDIVLETPDDRYKGTLEDFGVLPTKEDLEEALEEFGCDDE